MSEIVDRSIEDVKTALQVIEDIVSRANILSLNVQLKLIVQEIIDRVFLYLRYNI